MHDKTRQMLMYTTISCLDLIGGFLTKILKKFGHPWKILPLGNIMRLPVKVSKTPEHLPNLKS